MGIQTRLKLAQKNVFLTRPRPEFTWKISFSSGKVNPKLTFRTSKHFSDFLAILTPISEDCPWMWGSFLRPPYRSSMQGREEVHGCKGQGYPLDLHSRIPWSTRREQGCPRVRGREFPLVLHSCRTGGNLPSCTDGLYPSHQWTLWTGGILLPCISGSSLLVCMSLYRRRRKVPLNIWPVL